MGFGKQEVEARRVGKDGFKYTTGRELKMIAIRARRREKEEKLRKKLPRDKIRLKLEKNLPTKKIYPKAVARYLTDTIKRRRKAYAMDKTKHARWAPRKLVYELWDEPKRADTNFIYDVQAFLASLSWKELTWLINAGTGEEIETKNFSEAFHFAQNIVHQALGVTLSSDAMHYRLKDRDSVLETWPVEIIERKVKMKKSDAQAVKSGKMKASARADEDEEEETEEEETEEETTEDEEEEEEDDTEEEETEEEEEEEPEEEEEEKPKKKVKAKAKAEPKAKKAFGKKKKVVEEDDEDEDQTGDDQEEKRKVKSKKKVVKEEKPEKAKKAKGTRATEDTKYAVKKTFKSGVRADAQSVISPRCSTMSQIVDACKKKFKIPEKKTRSYINWLAANGFLTRS